MGRLKFRRRMYKMGSSRRFVFWRALPDEEGDSGHPNAKEPFDVCGDASLDSSSRLHLYDMSLDDDDDDEIVDGVVVDDGTNGKEIEKETEKETIDRVDVKYKGKKGDLDRFVGRDVGWRFGRGAAEGDETASESMDDSYSSLSKKSSLSGDSSSFLSSSTNTIANDQSKVAQQRHARSSSSSRLPPRRSLSTKLLSCDGGDKDNGNQNEGLVNPKVHEEVHKDAQQVSVNRDNPTIAEETSAAAAAEGSKTTTTTTTKGEKGVQFSTLTIRSYPIRVGDNPAVTRGVPLTIGWDFDQEVRCDIDEYETQRGYRRNMSQLKIPSMQRMTMLLDMGFSRKEIVEHTKLVEKIREKRLRTIRSLGVLTCLEEQWETVWKRKLWSNKNRHSI